MEQAQSSTRAHGITNAPSQGRKLTGASSHSPAKRLGAKGNIHHGRGREVPSRIRIPSDAGTEDPKQRHRGANRASQQPLHHARPTELGYGSWAGAGSPKSGGGGGGKRKPPSESDSGTSALVYRRGGAAEGCRGRGRAAAAAAGGGQLTSGSGSTC
jgi:hypothetical protein